MNEYPTCFACGESFRPWDDHTFCSEACRTIALARQGVDERENGTAIHPLFRSILHAFGLK